MSSRVVWWSFARDAGAPSRRSRSDAKSMATAGEAGTGGKASPARRLRLGVSSSSSSPGGSIEPNGGEGGVARPASSADPREERGRLAAGEQHARGTFSSLASTPSCGRRSAWTKTRETGEHSSDATTRRAAARFGSRAVRFRSWFGSARARGGVVEVARAGARGRRGIAGVAPRGAIRASGEARRRDRNERHRGRARGGGRGGRAVPGVVPRREERASLGFCDATPGTAGTALLRAAAAPPRVTSASGPAHMLSSWVPTPTRGAPRAGDVPRAPLCGRRRGFGNGIFLFPKKTRRVRTRSSNTYRRGSRGRGSSSAEIAYTWHHAAYPRDRASYRAP